MAKPTKPSGSGLSREQDATSDSSLAEEAGSQAVEVQHKRKGGGPADAKDKEEEEALPEVLHMGRIAMEARKRKGMTQAEVAIAAGMNTTSVFMFESGRQNMTIKNIVMLARALDLELADLVPRNAPSSAADLLELAASLTATIERMEAQMRMVQAYVEQVRKYAEG